MEEGEGDANHRVRGEQRPGHPVQVPQGELDAGVGEAQLVHVGGRVTGADVALAGERRHGDGVLQLVLGQVVGDPAVDVPLGQEIEN